MKIPMLKPRCAAADCTVEPCATFTAAGRARTLCSLHGYLAMTMLGAVATDVTDAVAFDYMLNALKTDGNKIQAGEIKEA